MKRFAMFILLAFAAMFLLSGCQAAPTSLAVQLPQELVVLIGMVTLVAITAAFKWLGSKLGGVDLQDRAAEIASAVSAVIVLAINYALGLIPAAYDSLISGVFAFLIVFLGGAGIYSVFLRRKSRSPLFGKGSAA